jgi:Ca2+-binding EF-hand superfamily protein|eukprot:SAG25_NODE_818_length_5222_cov_5.208626_2_plen_38_part_00
MLGTLFASFDTDRDGWLSRAEYRHFLRTIGVWAAVPA